jgi:hypothetical protein
MEAIREIVEIKSNQLQFTLPTNFNEEKVEMILLPLAKSKEMVKIHKNRSMRGALSKYANKNLRKQEKDAWANAVEEKYATH